MKEIIGDVRLGVFLRTNVKPVNGDYPIYIRVSCCGDSKQFVVPGCHISEKKWKYLFTSRLQERKELVKRIEKQFDRCRVAVRTLVYSESFTFGNLQRLLEDKTDRSASKWLDDYIEQYAAEKRALGKYNTASTYDGLCRSIKAAFPKRVKVKDVDVQFLDTYVGFLVKSGNSAATVAIRVRSLKSIINWLIRLKLYPAKMYPFKDYRIPYGGRRNMALSKSVLERIKSDAVSQERLKLWLLSYYMHGINYADLLRLRRSDVDLKNGCIRYFRSKTSDRCRIKEPVVVPLTESIKELLSSFMNFSGIGRLRSDGYLLPYLKEDMNEEQVYKCIKAERDAVNRWFARNYKDVKVSTYSARHTFATNMRNNGASTELISQCLGHTSTAVTRHYLDSIDIDRVAKFTEQL